MSPYFSSWAIFCRLPYFKYFFMSVPRCRRKFAPGCTSGPLRTSLRKNSMLALLTRSGYVNMTATCTGTATFSVVFNLSLVSIKAMIKFLKFLRNNYDLVRNRCLQTDSRQILGHFGSTFGPIQCQFEAFLMDF